jgi:phasin family protein
MFPFSQSVTPAVRSHMDAQMSFVNDLTKSMFRSFQQMCDLNIQLAQTLLEETTLASQQLMTAERPPELISAAASRAQPATEKLKAYQQHISRVAADAQVDLARVTEQHVQETVRTARVLADEVQRVASEETERGMRTQQETMRKFTDPFHTGDAGAQQAQPRGGNGSAGASMQSAGQGGSQSGSQGSEMQGGASGSMQSDMSSSGGQTQASQAAQSAGSPSTSGGSSGSIAGKSTGAGSPRKE